MQEEHRDSRCSVRPLLNAIRGRQGQPFAVAFTRNT
jgi:hypothetical protein